MDSLNIFPRSPGPTATPTCSGDVGTGICINVSATSCPSLQYVGRCAGPADIQCCLIRDCTVPQGSGYCRDLSTQNCTAGKFFAGSPPNWPCPGNNNVQCCVKYQDMVNGTSNSTAKSTFTTTSSLPLSTVKTTSSLPLSAVTTTSSPPVSTNTAPPSNSNSNLTGGQIAGVVVGVVAAVLLLTLIIFLLFYRKRKNSQTNAQTNQETTPGGDKGDGDAVLARNEAHKGELEGNPIKEEAEPSPISPGEKSGKFDDRVFSELPGSDVPMAEMPSP